MSSTMDLATQYCAHNYHPIPVVLARGASVLVRDEAGNKHLDMMRACSAVSHSRAHPRLPHLFQEQVARLTGVARALIHDVLNELNEHRLAA